MPTCSDPFAAMESLLTGGGDDSPAADADADEPEADDFAALEAMLNM